MRVSHLTPVLALWPRPRGATRDTRGAPGLLVGLGDAVKFFVWPLVALARGHAPHARRSRGCSCGRARPSSSCCRTRGSTTTPGRSSISAVHSTRTATRSSGLLVQAGAPKRRRGRRCVGRRRSSSPDLALSQLHARDRRSARALAHRLARLLRSRGAAARDRTAPTLVGSGSCRSRRGVSGRRPRHRRLLRHRPAARRLRDSCSGSRSHTSARPERDQAREPPHTAPQAHAPVGRSSET